jgi:hypothetical protein
MNDTPDIVSIAALVADPARAAMLTLRMDGKSNTATEPAVEGDVTPSTASSLLAPEQTHSILRYENDLSIVKTNASLAAALMNPHLKTGIDALRLVYRAGNQ